MNNIKLLKEQLSQRILFLDGAMGTMIQSYNLEEKIIGVSVFPTG